MTAAFQPARSRAGRLYEPEEHRARNGV